jgi:hypothetical protein
MPRIATTGLIALFMSVAPLAHAQQLSAAGTGQDLPSAADLKAFADTRIDVVKMALQLTSDQTKYWPAVEEAIRERSDGRQRRLASLADKAKGQREFSPIDILREHADGLGQRSAELKKLVDAWQPLYESLEPRQKVRLRFLAKYVLHEMSDRIASRFGGDDDDSDY